MDRRDFLGIVPFAAIEVLHPEVAQGQGQGRGQGQAAPRRGHQFIETPVSVRQKFSGMYRLANYRPHGDSPRGRIYYDLAGRMGAMLDAPGRKVLPQSPSAEDYREMLRGMVAYYGTYSVDESTKRVIHHIEAGSNPAWIGTDFVRWFEFNGNRLTLRTVETLTPTTNVLVWERLPER